MQYHVLTPIRCNGQHYEQGTTAELSGDIARELLDMGAIQPVHVPFAEAASKEI